MKTAREWAAELAQEPLRPGIEVVPCQSGETTLRVDGVLMHSKYRPREEAFRLIESAELEPGKPVIVVGAGSGYHVRALIELGRSVVVVEPDRGVAKNAVEGALEGCDAPLHLGNPEVLLGDETFRAYVERGAQVFVHPPTERLHPQYANAVRGIVARLSLHGKRLGVAIVGPMYGGSLPLCTYLANAFKRLGHRTLFVDNSEAWALYQSITGTVESKNASGQLGSLLANVLEQWSYARVAEFAPNVCIVMAQAPVSPAFPLRLKKEKIVSAFWFVENWRHMPYWRHICAHYDSFFHIQPGEFEKKLEEAGCTNHAFVQSACDPEVHKPVKLSKEELAEYGCEISFAGAGYYNRNQFLAGLTDYQLKIWGTEWHARELQPFLCRPEKRFTADEFAKIVAGAAVNLNLHSSATHSGVDPRCDAINPRVFEIAACGGFQLCDPCKGLDRFFDPQSELPTYRDLPECRRLIDRYLPDDSERKAIAARARERALREHTYAHRAQQMLDFVVERFADRIADKGVRAQRTVSEIIERVGAASPLGAYLATLPPDTPFAQAALNERIPLMGAKLSHAEGVFAYLRELRTSAETLLEMFDGA
ncbi:MAG: glycosyltransferase [Candidatus Hydrogenedentes bacterium]|nr:glycosyltransferase [Candidatus Hydrogenedentota bacterium]